MTPAPRPEKVQHVEEIAEPDSGEGNVSTLIHIAAAPPPPEAGAPTWQVTKGVARRAATTRSGQRSRSWSSPSSTRRVTASRRPERSTGALGRGPPNGRGSGGAEGGGVARNRPQPPP